MLWQSADHMLLPVSVTFLLQAVAHSLSAPRVSQVAIRARFPIIHRFIHREAKRRRSLKTYEI